MRSQSEAIKFKTCPMPIAYVRTPSSVNTYGSCSDSFNQRFTSVNVTLKFK